MGDRLVGREPWLGFGHTRVSRVVNNELMLKRVILRAYTPGGLVHRSAYIGGEELALCFMQE